LAAAEPAPFEVESGAEIFGETLGAGPPVVLCHGITATRRNVLHGSRVIPRAGFRTISFDARAHGESGPAPPGEGYGYPEMVADLEAVIDSQVGEGAFVLAGHSMGAHTAVAYALENPGRLAGLIVIGPVYGGQITDEALAKWDARAEALSSGGADGFVEQIDREGIDAAWRQTILRITRERILLHRHPGALAEALRQVPRSRPFETMDELEFLDVPALVVASHDVADPGHPYAVAEAYAERLPGAQLLSEGEGESPLAWQGGKLSRELATFLGRPKVAKRLAADRSQ